MARTTFRLCMAEYIPLFTLAHPNFLPASSLYNAMINEGLSTHMQVLVTQVVPNLKFPTSPMLFPPPLPPRPSTCLTLTVSPASAHPPTHPGGGVEGT